MPKCRVCQVELADSNWFASDKKKHAHWCRQCRYEWFRIWRLENKERFKKYYLEYRRKLRQHLLVALGGKCVRCGETDWRCLQVDHIHGHGRQHIRTAATSTVMYQNRILREIKNGSKEYQLLCANCNWRKMYEQNENAYAYASVKHKLVP